MNVKKVTLKCFKTDLSMLDVYSKLGGIKYLLFKNHTLLFCFLVLYIVFYAIFSQELTTTTEVTFGSHNSSPTMIITSDSTWNFDKVKSHLECIIGLAHLEHVLE